MRTLADYRPQHDEDCEVNRCGNCGHWRGDPTMHGYGDPCDDWKVKPCSCGLDALLSSVRAEQGHRSEEEQDNAALLPADPSAAVQTEALPNYDFCPTCGTALGGQYE